MTNHPFDCKYWQKRFDTPILIYHCIKGRSYCPNCIEFTPKNKDRGKDNDRKIS